MAIDIHVPAKAAALYAPSCSNKNGNVTFRVAENDHKQFSQKMHVLNGIDNSIHAHLQMIKLLKSKGKFMQFINISIINLAKQVDY